MTTPHIMLDLETLGTKPGCIVLTVGAVQFHPKTGEIVERFYEKLSFKQSVLIGLKCDPTTYAWWAKQDEAVRKEAFSGAADPREVVTSFAKWAHRNGTPEHWWAQGMDFDYPIFEAVCRATNTQPPWKFWAKRDTRTVYSVADFDPKSISRDGNHHNALDDCVHQVACVHAAYVKLGIGSQPAATQPATDPHEEVYEL